MQSIEPFIAVAGAPIAMTKAHAVGDAQEGGWVRSVCGSVRRNATVPVRVTKGIYRAPSFGHFDPSHEDACESCLAVLKEDGALKKLKTQQEHFSQPQLDAKGRPTLSFWIKRAN